jgi:uncharacterized protein (TIGR00645 family)
MGRIKRSVEAVVFGSRWLVAPFLMGLIVGLAALFYKFAVKLFEFVIQLPTAAAADVIVGVLSLIDLTLTANLILLSFAPAMRIFSRPFNPRRTPTGRKDLTRSASPG